MDSRAAIDHTGNEPVDPPISVAHLMRTLRGYLPVILLTLASVAIVYTLVAVAVMIARPSQTVTTVRFLLNFTGADKGVYPNGAKFNASTVVSPAVLLKVYQANDVARFSTFSTFTQSIVVLESNTALERLNTEYQTRLADPKLTPVDRDRLAHEFDAKRDSLGKNEFALNYTRGKGSIPDAVVRKILSDILVTWANDAENEQRLFDFPMAVLSPDVLNVTSAEKNDPMIAVLILRSTIGRVLMNVSQLEAVPGAVLIRTPSQKMSLPEVRLRLEDTLRFRVEPLLTMIRTGGLIRNPVATTQFLESQLTYDQFRLHDLQHRSDAIRNALLVYTNSSQGGGGEQRASMTTMPPASGRDTRGNGDTITPIINDSFIDRLVAMSNQPDEIKYRQKAADDYRQAIVDVIPAEQAVEYDKDLLELVRRVPAGASSMSPEITNDIETMRSDSRALVGQLNEIYLILSRTINPASQIYSVTEAPTTTIQRTGDLRRGFLGLVLVLLLTLPIVVVVCLLHNRVREEETANDELREAV